MGRPGELVKEVEGPSKADRKSHFLSMLVGCGIGALVGSMVLLAIVMAYNGGQYPPV